MAIPTYLEEHVANKDKYLKYYKQKYQSHFSPAMLDYLVEEKFNNALKTYRPEKGIDFKTHLAIHMKTLSREALNKGSLLRESEYDKQLTNKVKKLYNNYLIKDKEPNINEIAKKLKISPSKVEEILYNNVHVAIVHGLDTSGLEISPRDLLTNINKEDEKVLNTIEQDMPLEKALKYTGLKKTTYYEKRKEIQNKLRRAYLNMLKNTGAFDGYS